MEKTNDIPEKVKKIPPSKSKGIFSDLVNFLLKKPKIQTLVKFGSKRDRQLYSQRVMQRLAVDVKEYGILNIHQIGVDVPAKYIFEELLKWNGDSSCWPNYLAKAERVNNQLDNICILLFGRQKYPFGLKKSFLGLKFIPLFNLNKIRFQQVPDLANSDNARYLLYKCSGGYPVGIFSMYVRSSILDLLEEEQSQLFLLVGFNFYGNKDWTKISLVNKVWEWVHNRVTSHILNRLKQLSEWRFEKIQEEMGKIDR